MLAFMGKRNNVLYIFLMLKSLYNVQVLSGSGWGCAAPFTCESRRKERERERHLERITSETMALVLWGGRFQQGRQFYTEVFFFAFVLISRNPVGMT